MGLNATAAVLLFPPQLDLNPDPQDEFDLLQGAASEYHAGIIRDLGMRLSLVSSSSTGGCIFASNSSQRSSITCSGGRRLIAEGIVDFSLNEMTFNGYEPPMDPLAFATPGPALYTAEASFLALPDDSEGSQVTKRGSARIS